MGIRGYRFPGRAGPASLRAASREASCHLHTLPCCPPPPFCVLTQHRAALLMYKTHGVSQRQLEVGGHLQVFHEFRELRHSPSEQKHPPRTLQTTPHLPNAPATPQRRMTFPEQRRNRELVTTAVSTTKSPPGVPPYPLSPGELYLKEL